LLLGE